MNDQQRCKIIIDYISDHPYCLKNDVVDGISKQISRKKVFDLLKDLILEHTVEKMTPKENSRDHRLFVNNNNPLVSVPRELEEFERVFTNFFNYVQERFLIDKNFSVDVPPSTKISKRTWLNFVVNISFVQPLDMFNLVVESYLYRSLVVWPNLIQDKEISRKLRTIVFTKIADIQSVLSDYLKEYGNEDIIPYWFRRSRQTFHLQHGINRLRRYTKMYKGHVLLYAGQRNSQIVDFNVYDELVPLLNIIWKITKEINKQLYPEPLLYEWKFDYNTDSWEKLLEVADQHHGQTLREYIHKAKKKEMKEIAEIDLRSDNIDDPIIVTYMEPSLKDMDDKE